MDTKTYTLGSLTLQMNITPSVVCVDWVGSCNHVDPKQVLGGVFSDLQVGRGDAQVEMRFSALRFLNSSTMAFIVQELRRLRQSRVPTKVVFDGSSRWQRIFGDALAMFDSGDGLFQVVLS